MEETQDQREHRLACNAREIMTMERSLPTELVAAARLAQAAMAECFHDDGDHVDDWEGLRAASERLYDALRPFSAVGV